MHVERNGESFDEILAENRAPGPDFAFHLYRDEAHELVLVYHGVSELELQAVQHGQASFALVVELPLIVLCYRFGNAIPWSVAPYRWNRLSSLEHSAIPGERPASSAHSVIRISLLEGESNQLVARRVAPLSWTLTRAWNAAIRSQAGRTCSEARFNAALTQFNRLFPHADSLLANTIATSIDGE